MSKEEKSEIGANEQKIEPQTSNFGDRLRSKAAIISAAAAAALGSSVLAGAESKTAGQPNNSYPGRELLAANTIGAWTPNHPQPPISTNPLEMTIDARTNTPVGTSLPDQDFQAPVELYHRPSNKSQEAYALPNGANVRVVAYYGNGQNSADSRGYSSRTWALVEPAPGYPLAWMPLSELGWNQAALDGARAAGYISKGQ